MCLRNYRYSGKAISITYCECVFVALGIQYAMRHIAISAPPRSTIFSPHYLTKGTILEKKSLNTKCVFWFSVQLLSETFLILRRNEQDIIYCISTVNRQHFPTLSHKRAGFSKKKMLLNTKCVFWFSVQLLSFIFLILRRNERDIMKNIYRSACTVHWGSAQAVWPIRGIEV